MDEDRALLPSERADARAVVEREARERALARDRQIRADFIKTFQTEHGRRVMAWLKQRCGFGQIILSADRKDGKIDPLMTTFAAMELNLYITMRNYLPLELIQEIEDDRRTEPSGHISQPDTGKRAERVTKRGRKSSRSD